MIDFSGTTVGASNDYTPTEVSDGCTGQTLYLVLDSYGGGSTGTFTLTGTISCPPVGVEPGTWSQLKARIGQ